MKDAGTPHALRVGSGYGTLQAISVSERGLFKYRFNPDRVELLSLQNLQIAYIEHALLWRI